jgi:hypothetical protein
MIKELLFTDVGLLSLICIIAMIIGSIWLYFWAEKKIKVDTAAKRERDKLRAAAAARKA